MASPEIGLHRNSAKEDCRTCRRRRIRCDRGLPNCYKCSTRNLECPGYGSHLRWANGIAVRGRFRGLQAPDLSNGVPKANKLNAETDSSASRISPGHISPGHSSTGLASEVGSELMPNFPDETIIFKLLDHYDKEIAGLMVWLDSETNEYRRLVLPLAKQQPVLLLAILAISAEHLASTSEIDLGFSKSACDTAVMLITQQVYKVTQRLAEGNDLSNEMNSGMAEWMLASMLILSNYAMIGSESAAAQSHRQAARTLVNALATVNRRDNELFTFLKNQLSIYDVLACTTTFDSTCTGEVILPEPGRTDVVFAEFLTLLHQVTLWSRDAGAKTLGIPMKSIPPPSSLRGKFEVARGSTLMAAGLLTLPHNKQKCHDFMRLVDIYHHAALLYAYKGVYKLSPDHPDVEWSATLLFERLDELEEISACLQNLPWPVFVAGLESHGKRMRRDLTTSVYRMLIENTGFNHYRLVLDFLQEFWAGSGEDWLQKAREWESQGRRLIPV